MFSNYQKKVIARNTANYEEFNFLIERLLSDMRDSEPVVATPTTAFEKCQDILKNHSKINYNADANLSELNKNNGTKLLISYAPNYLDPNNVDCSRTTLTADAGFRRVYTIYLRMLGFDTSQEEDNRKSMLPILTRLVLDNLTNNDTTIEINTPYSATQEVEYSMNLTQNIASEPVITTEKEGDESGYVVSVLDIVFVGARNGLV